MGPLVTESRPPDHVQEDRRRSDDEHRRRDTLDTVRDDVAQLTEHDEGAEDASRQPDHDDRDVSALVGRMTTPVQDPYQQRQPDDDQRDELEILHVAMIRPSLAARVQAVHAIRGSGRMA